MTDVIQTEAICSLEIVWLAIAYSPTGALHRTMEQSHDIRKLWRDYLNSVPYLRAVSRICSLVSCLGGAQGGLQQPQGRSCQEINHLDE